MLTRAFTLLTASPAALASPVEVWLGDPRAGVYLEPQRERSFAFGQAEENTVVAVDETRRYQTMLGFGASFTGSSACLVQERLSAEPYRAASA